MSAESAGETPVTSSTVAPSDAEQELLIYGSQHGARRSVLLSAEEEDEPEEETPSAPAKVQER